MNYSRQIVHSYYKTLKADFEVMLDEVLNQLPTDVLIVRLVCWCAPSDNEEYEKWLSLSKRRVREYFTDCVPGFTLVAQPPLDCGMVLEAHALQPYSQDVVYYKKFEKHPYVVVENPFGRFLFASGFHGSGLLATAALQSQEAFKQVEGLLQSEGFAPSDIIRQWNYIERITDRDADDQRYQSLNNARADYYAKADWNNGYPAATGIGTSLGGVCVDVDAVIATNQQCRILPIDNALQVAAHDYSSDVILSSGAQKESPKFERAKSVEFPQSKLIYISGTAAIRGEESLEGVGLARQIEVTVENIAQLTQNLPIRHLRVYLKNPADYKEAAQLLTTTYPTAEIAFFEADVCRDELLLEIEGIASSDL